MVRLLRLYGLAALRRPSAVDDFACVSRVLMFRWLLLLARGVDVWLALNSGARADIPGPPLWAKADYAASNRGSISARNKLIPSFATIAALFPCE